MTAKEPEDQSKTDREVKAFDQIVEKVGEYIEGPGYKNDPQSKFWRDGMMRNASGGVHPQVTIEAAKQMAAAPNAQARRAIRAGAVGKIISSLFQGK